MEKLNRVINVRNLNDETRSFDIRELLLRSSDCIFTYAGAYTEMNGEIVSVQRDDERAEFYSYVDMESGKTVKVPVVYSDVFEKVNYVSSFTSANNVLNKDFYDGIKNKEKENQKFVRTISSQR